MLLEMEKLYRAIKGRGGLQDCVEDLQRRAARPPLLQLIEASGLKKGLDADEIDVADGAERQFARPTDLH